MLTSICIYIVILYCCITLTATFHINSKKTSKVNVDKIKTQLASKQQNIDIDSQFRTLQQAAINREIDSDVVISLLRNFDQPNKIRGPALNQLEGKWELIFSSLIPGGYFPITEKCDFFEFSLESSWKSFPLGKFLGNSEVISADPLILEFYNTCFVLGPLKIPINGIKKRSYTFFTIKEGISVAKSSSGGFTLLKKL